MRKLLSALLIASTAALQYLSSCKVPRVCQAQMATTTKDYEFEMAFAARVVREAGHLLIDPTAPECAAADAEQHLNFELQHEPAISISTAQWVHHVDSHIVSIALVDAVEGPVVGAVCRPFTNELICAARNGGAYVQNGDEALKPAQTCGIVSQSCNVVHVPHDRCPELEMALESLSDRMPLDVTRVQRCCCCEGLFEVVSGRADIHLSPPEYCYLGQQLTPVSVLCAFDVLLGETGGQMTDVLGNKIKLTVGEEHRGGVLASEAASHNYMLYAIHNIFSKERLVLPWLADALDIDSINFRVEHTDSGAAEGGEMNAVAASGEPSSSEAFAAAQGDFFARKRVEFQKLLHTIRPGDWADELWWDEWDLQ